MFSTPAPACADYAFWSLRTAAASTSAPATGSCCPLARCETSSSPKRLGRSGEIPGGRTRDVESAGERSTAPMIGIAALVVGIVLGLVFHPSVPEAIQPYLPIAVVAALDAVFGGLRAYLERIFDPRGVVGA